MSFAGFDTYGYPGDTAMEKWKAYSPYQFVGYYLKAPCHPDASWMGTRTTLKGMGWGLAVLYVGRQGGSGCGHASLSAEQGTADATNASAVAAVEGFPHDTRIFLDVERVEEIEDKLMDYFKAWVGQLINEGNYVPGFYCHVHNADDLWDAALSTFQAHGSGEQPMMWVTGGKNFDLTKEPSDSGISAAKIWQGRLDFEEIWGDAKLKIDASVASNPNPSNT